MYKNIFATRIMWFVFTLITFQINTSLMVMADSGDMGNTVPVGVEHLKEDAISYLSSGESEMAIDSYSAIVSGFPGTKYAMESLGELGRIYINRSDETGLNNVIAQLFQKYSSQPTITRTIDYIAQGFLNKNPEKAQELYDEALKKLSNHPDITWLHGASIRCKVTQLDLTDARESIKEFQKKYSEYSDLNLIIYSLAETCRTWKKYEFVRDLYEYTLKNSTDKGQKIDSLTGIGLCKIRLMKYDEVEDIIEKLKSNYGGHDELCANLTEIAYEYGNVKDWDKGKELCKYIFNTFPEHENAVSVHRTLVKYEIRLNNLDAANDELQKLIKNYSDHKHYWRELGYAALEYQWKGNLEKNKSILRHITKNCPDEMRAIKAQSQIVRCELNQDNHSNVEKEIGTLKKMLQKVRSENSYLHSELMSIGQIFYRQKKYDNAKNLYQYVSKKSNDELSIKAHVQTIRCLKEIGDFKEIEKEIEEVKNILQKTSSENGGLFSELSSIAEMFHNQKEYTKAINLYQYIQNNSDKRLPIVDQRLLAQCEIRLGNKEAADKAVEKLKKEYSDHKAYWRELYYIAFEYSWKGHLDESKRIWRYVANNSSNNNWAIQAQTQLILCKMTEGEVIKKEIDILKDMLQAEPENDQFYSVIMPIARKYFIQEKYEEARNLYQYIAHNTKDNIEAQTQIMICLIASNKIKAIEKKINDFKTLFKENSENKKLRQKLLAIAGGLYRQEMYFKAKDVYQFLIHNNPNDSIMIDTHAQIIRCLKMLNDFDDLEREISEFLEFDLNKHSKKFIFIRNCAIFYKTKQMYDKAKWLYKYIFNKCADKNLAFNAQVQILDCEIRSDNKGGFQKALETYRNNCSTHPNYYKSMYSTANLLRMRKGRKKAKEFGVIDIYHYIFENSSDENLRFEALKKNLVLKIYLRDQIGFHRDFDKFINEFPSHPNFNEAFEEICEHYRWIIMHNTGRQNWDIKVGEEFCKSMIKKFPESEFSIKAQCQLLRLNILKSPGNEKIDDEFKSFIADDSNNPKYFRHLNFILNERARFRNDYKKYTLEQIKKKLISYSALEDKANAIKLLIRYTNYLNYKEELDNLVIDLAKKDNCNLFINLIDEIRDSKEKRYAVDLCEKFLNLNSGSLCREVVLLKSYKIKIEDGQSDYELSKRLGKFISQNITDRKDLVCEAMLLKGRLLINLGEIEKAREIYEIYKEKASDSEDMPEVLYYIGYAYLIQGDYKNAENHLSTIIETFPKSKYARKANQYLRRIETMAK